MPSRCIYCVAPLLFLLLSCSTVRLPSDVTTSGDTITTPVRYSIVFVIHGDGKYRYHDTVGGSHQADEMALDSAHEIAAQNPQAEAFIFHERRRPGFLRRLITRRDGAFYYYRQGKLLAAESYRRYRKSERFDAAVNLYNQFRAPSELDQTRLFFYFGHEIPEFGGAGYDASHPRETFTVDDLAGGVEQWSRGAGRFDILVLATCYGGTPHTIAGLSPYARYIVASPENLHLSYFDLQPFKQLHLHLTRDSAHAFAEQFARHAFLRLTTEVQTAVTVALYDVDRVASYVTAVDSMYQRVISHREEPAPLLRLPIDCAEEPLFTRPDMHEGVTLFYRPPQFGRARSKRDHSGWECPAL